MRISDSFNYAKYCNIIVRMANSRDTWITRRIGIPRIRMDLQFMFLWCKLIFMINIHYSMSLCSGLDIGIFTYPQGDINIPYPGHPLEVFCTAEYNYTSKDLYFHVGHKKYNSEIVNDTTIRLFIENPQLETFQLYCSTNTSVKKHCLNKVLIDRPPMEVTDFSCISKNFDVLNCSWSCPNTNTSITYELTFFASSTLMKNCQVQRVGNTRYCIWNTTSEPRYRQHFEFYQFNLKSENVFGKREQNFTIDHYAIVKPDKPNGTFSLVKQHSVRLSWELPINILDFLPDGVDHKIEYQIEKEPIFHQVNTSFLPPNKKKYIFNLTELPYAHYKYEVRIFIRPKRASLDQFWSDPLFFFITTDSEIPDRPPDIPPGSFTSGVYSGTRLLRVYWKQLEDYEENGANFTYRVLVKQENKEKTLFPDKSKSLSYVLINSTSTDSMHINVQSYNALGPSKNSSYIFIPPHNMMINGPTTFTQLAFENGTYELSWDSIQNIDNYTLFWCLYNSTQNCVGRMNFTIIKSMKTNHAIELPVQKKYQFAIAVNKGFQTSGMVWARCDISRDAVAMYSFPMHLSHGSAGKTFVDISWTMECQLKKGIITGYKISYCPIIKTSNVCDLNVKNESVYIDNPNISNISVTHLLPFRSYRFDISIDTIYGLKFTNESTYVTTLADKPSEPVNVRIYNITYNSLDISWDPPLTKNGNVVRYLIYNYSNETLYIDTVQNLTDISQRSATLTRLHGFTNYSLSVVACNSADMSLCSKRTDEILVRTCIGPPSKVRNASSDSASDVIKWKQPEYSAGILDLYQVKRIRDNQKEEIYNTTELSMNFIFCEGVKDFDKFHVRAVNLDNHPTHGAYAETSNVELPYDNNKNQITQVHFGEWSDQVLVRCKNNSAFYMVLISIVLIILVIGMAIGSVKLYKKYRKMEDIKPVLPTGLGLSEKDFPKYSYNWKSNETGKVTDEDLLLPNKMSTQSPVIKEETNNSSENTDSTTCSQTSLEHQDQEVVTSDEGSASSLHLDIETNKLGDGQELCESDTENPNTLNINDQVYNKNPVSGYIQPTSLANSNMPQMPIKNLPPKLPTQPSASSYVMASLATAPIFTTGVAVPSSGPSAMVGYVHPDDVRQQSPAINRPVNSQPPTKIHSPESLPTLPNLPPSKCNDSSYIQLQSLDAIHSSLKPAIRNTVPLKPPTSSGYISQDEAIINKRYNILAGGGLAEEMPVLDPTMSPDAYCRFSWSADPSKDNLTAILAESASINSPNK